ncbi:Wee1-like protein kinase 1-B [Acipenser ruthenus]|uniref:non-specific serine/threonine protein kinase n=1 Tax=Acipenser ruthenus TaxID=7906 RepID=A0A662YVT3_ACIRT|nr:Wee1-like protein kinase 1-B [Acipenser ruthenus]
MLGSSGQCYNEVYMPRLPYVGEEQIKVYEDYVIGSGNFGTVYRGSYQGTVAAIKKIPIQGSLNDITHEILICTRLSHPHIARVMAVSKTDRAILIANEYIHGASLEKVLHGDDANFRVLNEEEQCYIGLEVALAVEYIHSKNIIHQDIKPANILASVQ